MEPAGSADSWCPQHYCV